jgi:SPP1 gp7 family putative phage head morphogenesis protein
MTSILQQQLQVQQTIRQLKGQKPIRRLRKPRLAILPKTFEREYTSQLLGFLRTARRLVDETLIPQLGRIERDAGLVRDGMRNDAWPDDVNRVMDVARGSFEQITGRERVHTPQEMAQKVSKANKRKVIKQFKGMVGVDIFFAEPELGPLLASWTAENTSLIRTVEGEFFDRIELATLRGFNAGKRAGEVSEDIRKSMETSENRFRLIARDQINKLQGSLTRHRQTTLGVKRYIWRTSLDARVRDSHQELEGNVYAWNGPPQPPEGPPGFPINCRCHAEPLIDDLLD